VKFRAIAICALVACASPAAADPRWAYSPGYASSPIPPYEIHATLRAMHLRPIGRAGWLGRHIAVRAVDNYGEVVRVLLDPRYGDVVSVVPLAAAGAGYRPYGAQPYRPYGAYRPSGAEPRYGTEPRYGAAPPDVRSEPGLPPAASTPPASRSAALPPPRLPLPRPRPAVSADTASANVVPEPTARPSTAPAPEPMARANPPPVEQPAPATGATSSGAPAGSFPPVPSFE
jgi:hypothetical protein